MNILLRIEPLNVVKWNLILKTKKYAETKQGKVVRPDI
jgi:hypothetical protein